MINVEANAKHIIDAMVTECELVRLNYQYCIDKDAFDYAFDKLKEKIKEKKAVAPAKEKELQKTK